MRTFIPDYLAELDSLLASPLKPIGDEQFGRLAQQLFAFQFENVPPYQALCRARRFAPDSVPDWTHIPAVPTASFKEFDWTSLAKGERTRVFHSSATTRDRPSRHFHSDASLAIYERSLLSWIRPWFLSDHPHRRDLCILSPEPVHAPHSSLVHMFGTLRREWGTAESRFVGRCDPGGRWIVEQDAVESVLMNSQKSGRPIALLGTAFNFVELLDKLTSSRMRVALPTGSRLLETGGYKGQSRVLPKHQLYHRLTERLGIPGTSIISEYGMCELSSQAYDHQAGAIEPVSGRTFRFPPWVRGRVIDPETNAPAQIGESGLLRLFDLANVYSVMTIQTDDLARSTPDGFRLLGRASAEVRGCSLQSR